MEIVCPECQHSRDLPEEKVPPGATVATCPKCATRFKFRELPAGDAASPADPSASPDAAPAGHAPQSPSSQLPLFTAPAGTSPKARAADGPAPPVPGPAETAPLADDQAGAPRSAGPPPSPTDPTVWTASGRLVTEEPQPERPRHPLAGTDGRSGNGDKRSRIDFRSILDAFGARQPEADRGRTARDNDAGAFDQPRHEVPWENPETHGVVGGFVGTIKETLFNPGSFFSGMPIGGGWSKPLVFYLIVAEIQAVAQFLHIFTGLSGSSMFGRGEGLGIGIGNMDLSFFLILVLMPIVMTMFLFVMAGVNHLSLKLAKAANAGFEGTFRALTYSSAPLVISIVPVIGPIIGILWSMSMTFMAFKHVHKTTYLRVAIAYTMTMAVAMLIANGIGFVFSTPMP